MYIHEAIKATQEGEHHLPCIRRRCWPYSRLRNEESVSVKIRPTNGPDCCVVLSSAQSGRCRGWQPTADDLTADDWETCL